MLDQELLAPFRESLLAGHYNLLLGSGVSLDSHNSAGELLKSSEELRKHLCHLTGLRESTSLSRVAALLTPEQRQAELVRKYSQCIPALSLDPLFQFLWRRIFSFNIDDVIENLHERSLRKKQELVTFNYDSPFESSSYREELAIVHLHGWVRRPESGFVFSTSEYARVISGLNPWMHVLSEILATESFVIAGTSLNEVDLEYYLSHRTPVSPRRGRGPSLLVEPFPDAATYSDCKRYGLILVPTTFASFLEWLGREFPAPPSVKDLIVPEIGGLFNPRPSERKLLRFFSDFELVAPVNGVLPSAPSPFLYGREPEWSDIGTHLDVERDANQIVSNRVRVLLAGQDNRILVVLDDAGVGKTTVLKRVALDFAREGKVVLNVRSLSRIDVDNARDCMSKISGKFILMVDNIADHLEQVSEIAGDGRLAQNILILGGERAYRRQHVELVLAGRSSELMPLESLSEPEVLQIIERYRNYGLIASRDAFVDPRSYAKDLVSDPLAVIVCRILNDFRPLDRIISSTWQATDSLGRTAYLCSALARHCYWAGLRYSLLQTIVGATKSIAEMVDRHAALPLAFNSRDDEFVVPLNSVLGEQVLLRASRVDKPLLLDAFCYVADALASRVNRKAIMRRSPEARLAGRLFDFDKVVRSLLGDMAENFYLDALDKWRWNSRYWEQRALLAAESDIDMALQYARHAVVIELHPFTLTTLGKLLLIKMNLAPSERERFFGEAFEKLEKAIEIEEANFRVTVHPFVTLLSGCSTFLESGAKLNSGQRQKIILYMNDARHRFRADPGVRVAVARLDRIL